MSVSRSSQPARTTSLGHAGKLPNSQITSDKALDQAEYTARLLHNATQSQALIHPSEPPSKRLKHLNACLRSVQLADACLYRTYAVAEFPASARCTQVAHLHRGIYINLADAFWKLTQSVTQQNKIARAHRGIVFSSVLGELNCLKNTIVISLLTYCTVPAGTWQRVHQAYALGMRAWTEIGTRSADQFIDSVHMLYKHTLLMATANTHTLPTEEILATEFALHHLATHARLVSRQALTQSAVAFLVPQQSDFPVIPANASPESNIHAMCLDTSGVVNRIAAEPSDSPLGQQLSPALRKHLAMAWHAKQRRQTQRRLLKTPIEITFGISQTYAALRDQNSFEQTMTKQSPTAQVTGAVLRDSSERGARLTLNTSQIGITKIGDVVGIFSNGQNGERRCLGIGTIRWLQSRNEPYAGTTLVLGLALLATGGYPLHAHLRYPTGAQGPTLPMIWLPEDSTQNMPATILTPASVKEAGWLIDVELGEQKHRLQLTQVTDQLSTACRFRFAAVANNDAKPDTRERTTKRNTTPRQRPRRSAA